MKKQIANISIHQSSKVVALLFFVLTALFFIPLGVYVFVTLGAAEGLFLFILPFLYLT